MAMKSDSQSATHSQVRRTLIVAVAADVVAVINAVVLLVVNCV